MCETRGYEITVRGTVITANYRLCPVKARRRRKPEARTFGISSACAGPPAFPDFVGTDRSEFSTVRHSSRNRGNPIAPDIEALFKWSAGDIDRDRDISFLRAGALRSSARNYS